jgi:hypothetical protein
MNGGTFMTDFEANEIELGWLAHRVERAEATPAHDCKPELRAQFLRSLFLGLPITGADSDVKSAIARFGLHVKGARITDRLDLADCRNATGGPLPPLVLEGCDIPEQIDLSGAHLARFSVKGSRIARIAARGLRLEGNFDFSGVRGFDPPPSDPDEAIAWIARQGIWIDERRPVAWIDALGAYIVGDVEGRGAELQAPARRGHVPTGMQRYALRLANCTIIGRVTLLDAFGAVGGVSFADADIRGQVEQSGASLFAVEGEALTAQGARFGSLVRLDEGFKAEGQVWLVDAKITGSLDCENATLGNPGGDALALQSTEIGGNVLLRGEKFKASGGVSLLGAKITGDLDCSNAIFSNPGGYALFFANAEIGGNVSLSGKKFGATGTISLFCVRISGNLLCNDATFANLGGEALIASGARIDGDLQFERSVVKGNLVLCGTRVGQDFEATTLPVPTRAHARAG